MDDGSTDRAVEELPSLIWTDPRIKVFRFMRQKGIAFRLNQIIQKSEGLYFARMDADDICHPQRLKKQISFLNRNPEITLLGCACLAIDEADRIIGKLSYPARHSKICSKPWDSFLSAHPSWIGKTTWFRQNPYKIPAPYRCEDQELLLRVHRSSKIANLSGHYLAYRMPKGIHLKRLIKTRLAWWKVQSAFFSKRGENGKILLCSSICLLKVLSDLLRFLRVLPGKNRLWRTNRGSKKNRILRW